eukprot:COSAG05_NODE_2764_length_2670_cov_3.347779_2_plen_102_part_00
MPDRKPVLTLTRVCLCLCLPAKGSQQQAAWKLAMLSQTAATLKAECLRSPKEGQKNVVGLERLLQGVLECTPEGGRETSLGLDTLEVRVDTHLPRSKCSPL